MYEDYSFHENHREAPVLLPETADRPKMRQDIHNLFDDFHLDYTGFRDFDGSWPSENEKGAPKNRSEHTEEEKQRWETVLDRVLECVLEEDIQNPALTSAIQELFTAILRERQCWGVNLRHEGRFLQLLDVCATTTREQNNYYDSEFSRLSDETEYILSSPDASPLLRRKALAMRSRSNFVFQNGDAESDQEAISKDKTKRERWLPSNPKILRELLKTFPTHIFLIRDGYAVYFDDLLKENPNTIDSLSDDALLALPMQTYFTGDEGVVEFLWKERVAALEQQSLRKSTDPIQSTVAPIAPGKIGVFDPMGRLLGVRSVLENTLYPVAEDPDLRHTNVADDIGFTFDIAIRENLSGDFGFPLEQLTLREQISLIGTFREINAAEEQRIVSTVKRFGIDSARAFLSTEFGDDFRGTVLSIAEKFPEDDAQQIFHSFSAIASLAQETADQLGRRFFVHDETYNTDAVRTELLSRAKDLLVTAESSDAQSIAAKLTRFQSDIVLFASMFKVTQKGRTVKFEDIRDVRLESLPSTDLTDADKKTMELILTENWQKQAPELLESTLKSLQESFHNPRSQFYILRKGNDVAASLRFDEQPDGSLYAGSLNVNDVYRSIGIGEAMLQSTIDALAKTHVITAHVPAYLPVATRYVNDFGLKIVGIDEEVLPDGAIARDLKLERNDTRNRYYDAHPHFERFDLTQGDAAIIKMVQYQAARGQVGTKFISDPLNPHLRFIAFEPAVVELAADINEERQAA